jgi:hypothetical protein
MDSEERTVFTSKLVVGEALDRLHGVRSIKQATATSSFSIIHHHLHPTQEHNNKSVIRHMPRQPRCTFFGS